MEIKLSDNFTYKKLIKFTLPPIVMMIFTSVYSMVDGYFVSNFVGKTPFAAINLIWPFLMICGAIGFMTGAGGSALVAKTFGEGKDEKANRYFSLLVYVSIAVGILISVLGIVFLRPISRLLGAEGETVDYCVEYGRIILFVLPFFMLQNEFQSFLVTAERPKFGLFITVLAGVTNMVLDFLLVGVFDFGLRGAAVATAMSQTVGGIVPLAYFAWNKKGRLRLGRTNFSFTVLFKTCTNGASEFVTNISLSLVSMIYNLQLLKIAGENGVAAYGTIMYLNFVFVAVFLGYTIGIAPVVGYHFGAENTDELKNLLKKSLKIVGVCALLMVGLSELFSRPLSLVFVAYDEELLQMTCHGYRLNSLNFFFCGFNIFGSAFFTALNDGLVSAVISFLRTLAFQVLCVFALPALVPASFRLDAVWLSLTVAEGLSLIVTYAFLVGKRKKYKYF